ncbi:MAG: NAD+ synthase [Synergistetes bacterium]|nr:NAD+ synthase [Synergistota bacterium]MCX8128015.1 NAD+ synthase [Synergistota bacterium]MDW8192790.1 NAD+ synthase [Synergistota bacterium]
MRKLRIGLAQLNSIVGDFNHNVYKICEFIKEGKSKKVDLLCFPELAITGYPPEDLLLKPAFIRDNLAALSKVAEFTKGLNLAILLGFVDVDSDIYNAAALLYDGDIKCIYRKMFLPNYGVFDEERYFKAGNTPVLFELLGVKVGITICEDIWYSIGPAIAEVLNGAELIVNISASPYQIGKRDLRERMLSIRALDMVTPIAYVNLVGGQDELVFDGYSLVLDGEGKIIARGDGFEECLLVVDLLFEEVPKNRLRDPRLRKEKIRSMLMHGEVKFVFINGCLKEEKPIISTYMGRALDFPEEVYRALVLGTRDYVKKNGFKKALVGLSGGIDSSLVATIAVDALGAQNVIGVYMPSRYSSFTSMEDAERLAFNLGIEFRVISIDSIFQVYLDVLSSHFSGTEPDATEENIQARIRGNILMALSNKFGWLVLTTGNKSEMACGYATLYGDMAGGFAVIKDVPKMLVYKLASWRNEVEGREIIPKRIFEKPPSAELKPDQKDSDTLPPYDLLDMIIEGYIEKNLSLEEIVSLGLDASIVRRVVGMIDRSEYKRRQAPPGIKITQLSFGKDRRFPITNRYKESLGL